MKANGIMPRGSGNGKRSRSRSPDNDTTEKAPEEDEDDEIRALKEKLKSFEQGGRTSNAGMNGAATAYMSEHASAESSSDESSASDSE